MEIQIEDINGQVRSINEEELKNAKTPWYGDWSHVYDGIYNDSIKVVSFKEDVVGDLIFTISPKTKVSKIYITYKREQYAPGWHIIDGDNNTILNETDNWGDSRDQITAEYNVQINNCNDPEACNYSEEGECKYFDCAGACGGPAEIDENGDCMIEIIM